MKLIKIFLLFILLSLIFVRCQKSDKSTVLKNQPVSKETMKASEILPDTLVGKSVEKQNQQIFNSKYLAIKNATVNHHPIILDQKEFEKIYKNIDSTSTTLWECGNPFDWLDKDWMRKKYGSENNDKGTFENFDGKITTIYSKEIEFNTNNHIVLFNTAFAKKNSFQIPSHHINLDQNTTLEEFKTIFPNLELEKLENPNEVRFRMYLSHSSDDAFLFYFKNGKLDYFTLWWLLC